MGNELDATKYGWKKSKFPSNLNGRYQKRSVTILLRKYYTNALLDAR